MRDKSEEPISEAASMLGKKSAEARRAKWGEKEFKRRMREWGKTGGRPRKVKADEETGGDK